MTLTAVTPYRKCAFMRTLRGRLFALTLIVVIGQLAGTVAASTALLGSVSPSNRSSEGTVCTCPHAADGECPMHKHRPPASSPDTPRYVSCHSSTEIALTTLVGVTGLLAEGQQTEVPDGVSEAVVAASTEPLNLIRPPVSPPPRS